MTMMLPLFLSVVLLFTVLIGSSQGFLGGDLPQQNSFQGNNLQIEHSSKIVKIEPTILNEQKIVKRYLVFGYGSINDIKTVKSNLIHSVNTKDGFFSVESFQKMRQQNSMQQVIQLLKTFF